MGSLGHLSIAEPGALIGFLGPRVREVITGSPFPPGVQVAENLARRGVIDGVLPLDQLRGVAADALRVLMSPQDPQGQRQPEPDEAELTARDAWVSVQATRRKNRPGLRELLRHGAETFIPLRGTGSGESDLTVIMGMARFPGFSCVLAGQDRRAQQHAYLGPGALRLPSGFALAQELDLPVLTVVDTPGGELSTEAEHGGMGGEIARCLAALAALPVPVVSVILGEGSGGGALALMPADRTVCAEHGWVAPLPPEGASAIVHRTGDRAAEMAQLHRIRAVDLRATGVVDQIVPEHPDASGEPEEFCRRIVGEAGDHLAALLTMPREERLQARHDRYRTMV